MTQIPSAPQGESSPQTGPWRPEPPQPPPKPRRRVALIIAVVLLVGSVAVNFLLMTTVVALALGAPRGKLSVERVEHYPTVSDTVAIVSIKGIISDAPMGGPFGPQGTTVDFVREQVREALLDGDVKAVVLEVNSPGGSASASDAMLHELKKLAAKKPLVVSMGGLAASGGYYVSMGGKHIMAQRTCLTGSIGVIGQILTFQRLMDETLKIEAHTFKSGALKDAGNPFREMTEEEKVYFQQRLIEPIFERFVEVVVEGRKGKLAEADVRRLADGSIYTAEQALAFGLIDEIGYLDQAVEKAKELAGLKKANVVRYGRQAGLLSLLMGSTPAREPSVLNLTPETIHAWTTPQVLMLWRG